MMHVDHSLLALTMCSSFSAARLRATPNTLDSVMDWKNATENQEIVFCVVRVVRVGACEVVRVKCLSRVDLFSNSVSCVSRCCLLRAVTA